MPRKSATGGAPRWDLFEHEDKMRERERLRTSPTMVRFRFALAWRDIGSAYAVDLDALRRKYPTTCKVCEGSVCPECPPEELKAYAARNERIYGTADDPNEMDARRAFALWLRREVQVPRR